MNVIVCEGKTDSVFLSYYLIMKYGWKYYQNKKNISLKMNDDQDFSIYTKDEKLLGIWSVNGCSNFGGAVDWLEKYMSRSNDDRYRIEKIIYMIDRDTGIDDKDVLRTFQKYPHETIGTDWAQFTGVSKFYEDQKFEAMVLIIPDEEPGALETVFLSALRNHNPESEIIVDKTSAFIDAFQLNTYLRKNREKLKAKFLTVISLMEPIRSFDKVDTLIKSVDWHESDEINRIFSVFSQI